MFFVFLMKCNYYHQSEVSKGGLFVHFPLVKVDVMEWGTSVPKNMAYIPNEGVDMHGDADPGAFGSSNGILCVSLLLLNLSPLKVLFVSSPYCRYTGTTAPCRQKNSSSKCRIRVNGLCEMTASLSTRDSEVLQTLVPFTRQPTVPCKRKRE